MQEDTNALVDTEVARPLHTLADAGAAVSDVAAGMVVSGEGSFAVDDLLVVEQRVNDGELGAWVVGNFKIDIPVGTDDVDGGNADGEARLAVALGWAPTVADAEDALEELRSDATLGEPLSIVGRFTPTEAAQIPDPHDDPHRVLSMVPAQLVNLWADVDAPMYAGFLVLHPDDELTTPELAESVTAAQLDTIDSVPPIPPEKINWLNLFYAIEWVVFGGFAIYFWFRLTRDAWEREHEMQALIAAGEVPGPAAHEDSANDPERSAGATNGTSTQQ